MDGLDISGEDLIDERIFRCLDNPTIDDDDDETYQSALSDCPESVLNSSIPDNDQDLELEHKTKRLKTVDNKAEDWSEVVATLTRKQALTCSSTVSAGHYASDGVEQESKLIDKNSEASASESQISHKSDDINNGSKNASQESDEYSKVKELNSSPSPHVARNKSQYARVGSKSTPTLYQRFIQSNSVSLSKSPKFEALQCPYCVHGFVNFNALETHVIFCKKRKIAQSG